VAEAGRKLAAVVAVQSLLLPSTEPGGGYQLAGAGKPALTVAVQPTSTETQIRATLPKAGVVIVDGPSAPGFYGLALLDGDEVEAAMAVLAGSGLVTDMHATKE